MTAEDVEAAIPPGPVARWVLGARPRTLPAALVPVLVGTAAAHPWRPGPRLGAIAHNGTQIVNQPDGPRVSSWLCALGALVVALAVQVGTNYANDYSDGVRGTDDVRVGPVRLVASGLAPPAAVRRAALVAFGLAGVVGLGLAWATSWWILIVGAACLAAGWFYTGGPKPYGYVGLGEVFVFVFFGLVATVGTYYVQTLRLDAPVVWFAAVLVGLLATALLIGQQPSGHRHRRRRRQTHPGRPVGAAPGRLVLRGLCAGALRRRGGLVVDAGRHRHPGMAGRRAPSPPGAATCGRPGEDGLG